MKKDVVLTSNTLDRDNVFFMQLFYRYALRCCSARWPSSVCFAATFPLGEGFAQVVNKRGVVPSLHGVPRAFPEGEGGPALAGSDEGHVT